MSTDTDRLEREAEAHRSQVDETLERLKDRFSVGQIVDELSHYAREGQGAELAKNFGRQVRDNPLALGLVGAGIAWLFLGEGVREQGHRAKNSYDEWRGGDDDDDRYRRSLPSGSNRGYAGTYSGDAARSYASSTGRAEPYGGSSYRGTDPAYSGSGAYPGSGSTPSDGPGLADRARSAASSAGSTVSGAASSVGGAASDAASSVKGAVSGAASSVGSAASDAAGYVGGAYSSASDAVNRAGHDARDAAWRYGESTYRGAAYAGRRVKRTFLDTLQEEPLIIGAVAVAIGAAIGASLPSTRREDEWLGGARDRLRDDAYEYGREALHRAEHVAEEAYRAGSEEAERKGLKPAGGSGETVAEKVSSVVGAAVDTAKSETKKATETGGESKSEPQGTRPQGGSFG